MTPPEVVFGIEHIDDVTWHAEPGKRWQTLVVTRTYRRIAERIDLAHGAAWVNWRKAMQGAE